MAFGKPSGQTVAATLTLRDTPDGCTLSVHVHPGARANAITGTHDGALKISLTTPPTDGRANEEREPDVRLEWTVADPG